MKYAALLLLISLQSYAQDFTVFAHRGFRGLHPENTVSAFKKTLHYTPVLEMDIMISKDMEVVVTHDAVLNSKLYTDASGKPLANGYTPRIYELNAAEIQKYHIGITPHPGYPSQQQIKETIPTLNRVMEEVTAYAKTHGMQRPKYFIETKISEKTDHLKHPDPKIVVELLMKVLQKHTQPQEVIIQSFDPRTLSYIEKHYPEYETCLLDGKKIPLSVYLEQLDFRPDYFSPRFDQITAQTLEESKQYGIPLIGGNANSRKAVDQMKKWGIRYVISDFPYEMLTD